VALLPSSRVGGGEWKKDVRVGARAAGNEPAETKIRLLIKILSKQVTS
jgi:hypothetical protein